MADQYNSSDLLKSYDLDGDGTLDGNELERLAEQLSAQVTYNNELLAQVQDLEHQQLRSQRDVQDKQDALRKAMRVCEQVRSDYNESKKRLSIMQDVASRASEEANKARVELSVRTKEVDGLTKFADEAREEIKQLKEIRHDMFEETEKLRRDLERANDQLEKYSKDESSRSEKHRESYDKLSKEFADTRAGKIAVESELKMKKDEGEELAATVEKLAKELKQEKDKAELFRARAAKLEDDARNSMSQEAQIKSDLHNQQARAQRVEHELSSLRDMVDAKAAELNLSHKKNGDLMEMNNEMNNQIRALKSELEGVGSDCLQHAQARAQDKERFEIRIAELQEDVNNLTERLRREDAEHREETRRRGDDFAKQLAHADDRYSTLQNDYQELNQLLQSHRNDSSQQADTIKRERGDLEQKLATLTNENKALEEKLATKDMETRKESSKMLEEIQGLNRELSDRTTKHVLSLGSLQKTIQELTMACRELQEAHNATLSELDHIRADASSDLRSSGAAIQQWHAESRRSMLELVDVNNKMRFELDELRDALLAAEVCRDEEAAKVMMLDEQKGHLEDENRHLRERVESADRHVMERAHNVQAETESVQAMQTELAERLKVTTRQLEAANAQVRSLQLDNERLSNQIADSDKHSRQRTGDLEKELANVESKLRIATTEKDTVEAEMKTLKSSFVDMKNKVQKLQDELQALEAERRELIEREKKSASTFDTRLQSANETAKKFQSQTNQLNDLLTVVKQQRKHLQEDNMALRAELDDVLRKSLNSLTDAPTPDA